MPHNVELKAQLPDLPKADAAAKRLGASDEGVLEQVDTYFRADAGRLKLREINGERAELIWYSRPDDTQSKLSEYLISPVHDPPTMMACLRSAYRIETIVKKSRRLWLYRNVRIHLDEVEGLGDYLEFEAVLGPSHSEAEGQALVARLRGEFEIRDEDLIEGSYRELMLRNSQAT